jgi:hypothetical protein
MKFPKAFVIVCALLVAGTANAERVFDISFKTKFNSSGVRDAWTGSGVLTLKDDRTFILEWDWNGGVDEGTWLQEKNNLQLLCDGVTPSREFVEWEEQDANFFAGFPVIMTSHKYQVVRKFDKAGNLKMRSKLIQTFRPGPRGAGPLKMTWSVKYIGILR